ncbi:pyrroline-5-carboxylate reductase [Pseudomonas sp. GD03862]|uniref:pyrroline-5-carboxylate reductase n=1 Tax=Pseudomonas sp. GD03862 TaxID=2975391 RepID=UPI00244B8C64|nr:pyrroline-5-carboxylate reductase [Pseudomonas sp. GD03862]MDH0705385.1 pyrroline-5-carboxylate reductase [Pseudomonas sp. GD03862]
MIYGFIGTGTITEAMIHGLMASALSACSSVIVSPRNELVSSRLCAQYQQVTVGRSNQQVADSCDILVLAIRWQVAEEVLRDLVIPANTRIISVIAATDHQALGRWADVPVERIVRAIPLPFVAQCEGVTAIYPRDPVVSEFFDALGTAVCCDSKAEFDQLAVASALMGTYFGILDQVASWLQAKGMPKAKAQGYLKPLFASLGNFTHESEGVDFAGLRSDFSTKGGLNEQVFLDFDNGGGSRALLAALDNVLIKIQD